MRTATIARYNSSWSIRPATMDLWGKRKVTLDECATEWESGTVLVCKNEAGRLCFIYGIRGDYGVTIGDSHLCHNDHSLVNMGYYTIVNIVSFYKDDNNVVFESEAPYDRSTKASLAVFK